MSFESFGVTSFGDHSFFKNQEIAMKMEEGRSDASQMSVFSSKYYETNSMFGHRLHCVTGVCHWAR